MIFYQVKVSEYDEDEQYFAEYAAEAYFMNLQNAAEYVKKHIKDAERCYKITKDNSKFRITNRLQDENFSNSIEKREYSCVYNCYDIEDRQTLCSIHIYSIIPWD